MQASRFFILSTGSELSTGRSIDTNGPFMARKLVELGFEIFGMAILPDDPDRLRDEIKHLTETAGVDAIIMTGGLGPTEDDHTVDVLAELTGQEIEFEPRALHKLEVLSARWKNRFDSDAIRRQVRVLKDCRVLKNNAGLAPGMLIDYTPPGRENSVSIAAMPGVPQEMTFMFEKFLLPRLKEKHTRREVHRSEFYLYNVGESRFQEQFFGDGKGSTDPDAPQLTGLPVEREKFTPEFNWGITAARGNIKLFFESLEEKEVQELHDIARIAYPENYLSGNAIDLLHAHSVEKKHTLALADLCSGGLVAKLLSENSGASAYLRGNVVSSPIDTESVSTLLDMDKSALEEKGLVSEAAASVVAEALLKKMGTDYAGAVIGVADPADGTQTTPAGTMVLAVAGKDKETKTFNLFMPMDPGRIHEYGANILLFQLYRFMNT